MKKPRQGKVIVRLEKQAPQRPILVNARIIKEPVRPPVKVWVKVDRPAREEA